MSKWAVMFSIGGVGGMVVVALYHVCALEQSIPMVCYYPPAVMILLGAVCGVIDLWRRK